MDSYSQQHSTFEILLPIVSINLLLFHRASSARPIKYHSRTSLECVCKLKIVFHYRGHHSPTVKSMRHASDTDWSYALYKCRSHLKDR